MTRDPFGFAGLVFLAAGIFLFPPLSARAAPVEESVHDVVASGLDRVLGDSAMSGQDRAEVARFLDDAAADPLKFKREIDAGARLESLGDAHAEPPEAFLERAKAADSPQEMEAVLKKLAVLNIVLGERLSEKSHLALVKAMHASRNRLDAGRRQRVDMEVHETAKSLVLSSSGNRADSGVVRAHGGRERTWRELLLDARLRKPAQPRPQAQPQEDREPVGAGQKP